jgi:acyl-coenzyme A thioesterase PaaI-like protein
MNRVLSLQAKCSKWPFGQKIFSRLVAGMAPYFTTIKPLIEEVRPNYIQVSMKKRRAVHNHLKTVHAIAMCNLCEFAGGICMEASIPSHRRWIPVGMTVAYLKKAESDLLATCDLGQPDWDNIDYQICHVSVTDKNGLEVMTADIEMKVSDRPSKK